MLVYSIDYLGKRYFLRYSFLLRIKDFVSVIRMSIRGLNIDMNNGFFICIYYVISVIIRLELIIFCSILMFRELFRFICMNVFNYFM